jgi:chloramphenicol-sensitive protein RarD
LLDALPPIVIVSYRVIWALALLLLVTLIGHRWARLRAITTVRHVVWLAVAASVLAVNWLVYVFAVTTDHVVDASLGYFMNPLVSVVLAVVVLRERLTRTQWGAVGLAAAGVLVITTTSGVLPWVGLVLAVSFGLYGLIRKHLSVGTIEGLTIETAVLLPVAIVVLAVTGWDAFGSGAATGAVPIAVLVMLLGPVTAVPLLAFGAATRRLPLSVMGMLQYITPTIILVLGVTAFAEPMTRGEWVGFALIWIALAVLTWTLVRRTPRTLADVAATEAP